MIIPSDIPNQKQSTFSQNYQNITKGTNKLFLFAGDQKIEHLNDDYFGKNITQEDKNPEHLFQIASQSEIGCFATQYGLITRYANKYPNIPYIVKVNSKTNATKMDPLSKALVDIEDIIKLRDNGVNIVGIGYTIYPGSKYENQMFSEAGRLIAAAHREGLVTIIWSYPRGKHITDETDPHLIAGAAGIAACLGADFVKVNLPRKAEDPYEALKEAIQAAGNTGLITAGGSSKPAKEFLDQTAKIQHAGAAGSAVGRNIHQKPLKEAIEFCSEIAKTVYHQKS
ncbi:aldolase [Candidatus Peregrinibacteria bacterium]|nr:aldolase [Candidatus Peregrinibacteria bacterium]